MVAIGTGFGKMFLTNGVDRAADYRALMRRVAASEAWSVNESTFHGQPHAILRRRPKGWIQTSADGLRASRRSFATSMVRAGGSCTKLLGRSGLGKTSRNMPMVTVLQKLGRPGSAVTVSGSGFGPNESIKVKYRTGSPRARLTRNHDGHDYGRRQLLLLGEHTLRGQRRYQRLPPRGSHRILIRRQSLHRLHPDLSDTRLVNRTSGRTPSTASRQNVSASNYAAHVELMHRIRRSGRLGLRCLLAWSRSEVLA